jgi:hypothetical protein
MLTKDQIKKTYEGNVKIDDIVSAGEKFNSEHSSYFTSYPAFIEYFHNLENIEKHNLIIGINFTYGWMPTIFSFKLEKNSKKPREDYFEDSLAILNKVKKDVTCIPKPDELKLLMKFLNNSLVGTSKLLHFINPEVFPIWDSHVFNYITGEKQEEDKPRGLNINNIDAYTVYINFCKDIISKHDFENLHKRMEEKHKWNYTKMRTLELIMYESGKPSEKGKDS